MTHLFYNIFTPPPKAVLVIIAFVQLAFFWNLYCFLLQGNGVLLTFTENTVLLWVEIPVTVS